MATYSLMDSWQFGTSANSAGIRIGNNLYTCGLGTSGQLGNNGTTTSTLTQINLSSKVPISYSAGSTHAGVICSDGSVYMWGGNTNGQLGTGNTTSFSTPQQISFVSGKTPKKIVCSVNSTFILCTDGTLYGTGQNTYGILAQGNTTTPVTSFVAMQTSSNKLINDLTVGQDHIIVLCADNTLQGCGRNNSGQLGVGDTTDRTSFVTIPMANGKTPKSIQPFADRYATAVLCTDNITLQVCGFVRYSTIAAGTATTLTSLTEINLGATVNRIIGSANDFIIVYNDNSVSGIGANAYGVLGSPTGRVSSLRSLPTISGKTLNAVLMGLNFAYYVYSDGTMYSIGWNNSGQLGLGSSVTTSYTTQQLINNSADLGNAPANTAPDKPTGVSGLVGNGQVSVSFTAPASNGGATITSYRVTSNPGNFYADGSSSPIVVTGLTNGTAYTFTVTATNSVGTSLASDPSTAVTPATVPGTPSITSVTGGDKQATISFTAPVSNGGATITSYTITSSPGGKTKSGSISPLTVTDLSNGVSYTFTITATNCVGTSVASSTSFSVTPIAATAAIAASETDLSISSYINVQPVSSYAEKKKIIIDMRNGLKATTYANDSAKAIAKKTYIDSMRAKLGTSIQIIDPADFQSFIGTFTAAAQDLSSRSVTLVYPEYIDQSSTVDITNITSPSYIHIEVPVGYSVIIINGTSSKTVTFTGTTYTSGGTTYAVGDYVTIGDKSIKLVGIGSGLYEYNNGGGTGGDGGQAICFLGNAPVLTPSGYRRIDSLAVGDLVRTADGRDVAIQSVKHQRVIPSASVNPYVIPKGQFGATENLAISPRHCVAVPGRGMVEARELGLRQLSMKTVFDYYNLELPEWDNMVVAGVEVESLAPKKRVVITAAQFRELVRGRSLTAAQLSNIARTLTDGSVELTLSRKTRRL